MCCVSGVSTVACKLGLTVGLSFFQLRVHNFTLYIYSVGNRSIQWTISKPILPNPAAYDIRLFNAQRSDYHVVSSTVIALKT